MSCLAIGKPMSGMGMKPDDKYAVPGCSWCHLDAPDSIHKTGDEAKFWARYEIDPFELAAKYYAQYCAEQGSHATTKKPRSRVTIQARGFPKVHRKLQSRSSFK
jgi:hypothetical protein